MHKLGNKIMLMITAIGVISIAIAFVIASYENQVIKENQLKLRETVLKDMLKEKLWKKEDVALTNAVGFSANGVLKKALQTNNRNLAIDELASIGKQYTNNTNFKGIKIHLHTKDMKSFVRSWKLNTYGDDLSIFRSSIHKIKDTKKANVVYELGKSGMFIRGMVPIFDDSSSYIGSLEFMQGVGSVNRDFLNQNKHYIMLLNEEALKIAKNVANNKKIGNLYVANMKWFDPKTIDLVSSLDLNELFSQGYLLTNNHFVTFAPVKDINDKTVGYHIISESNELILSNIQRMERLEYIFLGLLIAVVLIVIIIMSIIIKKMVTNKLVNFSQGLDSFFKFLNHESNNIQKLDETSNDEFSVMAKVVNVNIENTQKIIQQDNILINEAQKVIEHVKKGWYSEHIKGSTSNKALEDFKNNVNEMIIETKHHFADMNSILAQYTNHDYTKKLEVSGIENGGVFEELINSINNLRESITTMLKENKTNGITLQNSSNELLDNVQILSTSSNEAAASLEETAAALEEITGNVNSTSEKAIQMSNYANELTTSANEGEKLANQTTLSMDQINEQVAAINEAITVIDQIAFQTNILSLNAAVEAATAGEAGKGFAVVAQEVRNLAARSAEAAKEIKDLVENATNKANDGKSIADKMIHGYNGLNENISKTLGLIKDVEMASKEQQSGIVQINDAINLLDQQTQQNANVANQTKEIAVQTQKIAQTVVEDADKKEFIGKNDIKTKTVSTSISTPASQSKPIQIKGAETKKVQSKPTAKTIIPNTKDDEWESF